MTDRKSRINALVSVVLPTYNRAHCLPRSIQSVLDQTYSQWELIIVDNYSTDNTDELVASYHDSRIYLFKIRNDGVIAASRNKGLYIAKGEYVAFLDSDDWWHPEKLLESVRQLNAGADIVYHDLYLISSLTGKKRFWKRAKTRQVRSPVFYDLLIRGNALNNSSVVVKRKLMNLIVGFSEDPFLVAVEDYDAWLRLAKHTSAFFRLSKTYGYYWNGGGNVSSHTQNIKSLERLAETYLNENLESGGFGASPSHAYVLGSAKFALGQFDEARAAFIRAFLLSKDQSLYFMCFKSILWLMNVEIKKLKYLLHN